jgi:chromosome segregation ATPase
MESLKKKKKNQTELLEAKSSLSQNKNRVENHSSRLAQVEDRISGLKEKIEIKEKKPKDPKAVKGICNTLVTPSKEQTCES